MVEPNLAHAEDDSGFIPERGVETFRHPWRNLMVGVALALVGGAVSLVVMKTSGDSQLEAALQRAQEGNLTDPVPFAGTLKGVPPGGEGQAFLRTLNQLDSSAAFSMGPLSNPEIDRARNRLRNEQLVLGTRDLRRANDLVRSQSEYHFRGSLAFHGYLLGPDLNDGHIDGLLDSVRLAQLFSSGNLAESRLGCKMLTDSLDVFEERLRIEAARAPADRTPDFGKQDAEFRSLCTGIDVVEASKLAILREPLFSPKMMGLLQEGTRVWSMGSLDELTGTAQRESADLILASLDLRAALGQVDVDDVIRDLEIIEYRLREEGDGILRDVRLHFAASLRASLPIAARLKALPPAPLPPR